MRAPEATEVVATSNTEDSNSNLSPNQTLSPLLDQPFEEKVEMLRFAFYTRKRVFKQARKA